MFSEKLLHLFRIHGLAVWQRHCGGGRGVRLRLRQRVQGVVLLGREPGQRAQVQAQAEHAVQSEPGSVLRALVHVRARHHRLHAQHRVPQHGHVHGPQRHVSAQRRHLLQAGQDRVQLGHPSVPVGRTCFSCSFKAHNYSINN